MIDVPTIVQTTPQPMAFIHVTCPRDQIMEVMGPGITELRAAVAAQGVTVTGPWFTHHLKNPDETFDFEICLPVASVVTPAGRVKPGELRGARVARLVYHGAYEGLGAAWGELETWIEATGHTSAPDLWERYIAGPESSANPLDWRTELNRPLVS